MKKFVFRFMAVLSAAMLCSGALVIASFVAMQNKVRKAFELMPHETTLFTGSSLIGCAIEEKDNDDYCVIWSSSTPIIFALFRLKELERLGYLKQLRRVVVGINYVDLYSRGSEESFIDGLSSQRNLLFAIRDIEYFPLSVQSFNPLRDVYNILHLGRGIVREIPPAEGTPLVSRDKNGPEWKMVLETIDSANAINEREMNEKINNVFTRNKRAIMEIKQFCARNEIEFVIVFTPLPSFTRERDLYGKKNFYLFEECFKEQNIRFVNCIDWIDDVYFRDGCHLLPDGAKVFTPMLLKALQRP